MANTFLLHSLLLTYWNCAPLSFLACRSFHRRQVPVPGLSSFPSLTRHLILLHSTLRLISVCVSRLCLISPALPYLPAFKPPTPHPHPPTPPPPFHPSLNTSQILARTHSPFHPPFMIRVQADILAEIAAPLRTSIYREVGGLNSS